MANDELELYFQPKIDARSGKVTAAEALLRWNHPTRGLVMPGEFIRLAERTGLIGPLGDWVIEAACRQARAWRDKGLRMRVAINLSAHQMRQDDIVDRIADALKRHRIRPSLLTCEITESAAMEDTRATQETFRRLGELGTHLSIDDFGTGYSSLAYLRKLPAEELKIDRSFVQDVEHSPDARAVVDAVLKLAHALGLKVVAEGVENPRQHQILAEMGCDELQGYLFAKPMTARALLLWAIGDRGEAAVFRNSLFGETRQTSRSWPAAADARDAGSARRATVRHLSASARRAAPHALQVALAVGRQPAALRGPDHLAQALHHLVLRLVRRAALRRQQLEGLLDAARLVDRHLLGDRQVHGQVQERVGAAALDVVDRRQRGLEVVELGVVLGVLGDPVGGQRLHRRQRQAVAALAVRVAEEAPHVVLGRGKHRDNCPSSRRHR